MWTMERCVMDSRARPGSIVLMADESAPRKDAAPASKERVIAIAGSGSNFRLILVPVDEQMRAVQGHTYREIKSRMLCLFCNKVDNKDVQFGSTRPTHEFSSPVVGSVQERPPIQHAGR